MIKTLLLVPIRDNDGRPFPYSAWRDLENRLRSFGGFSRQPLVHGQWADDTGRIYRDRSRRYVVSLSSVRAIPAWLAMVEWAQSRFSQEAMYIELAGQPEIVDFRESG